MLETNYPLMWYHISERQSPQMNFSVILLTFFFPLIMFNFTLWSMRLSEWWL